MIDLPLFYKRNEIKYIVRRDVAQKIQNLLKPYFYPDTHTHQHNGDRSYRVRTLYLDTHEFMWYLEKVSGQRLRKKIRVRAYEPEGAAKTNLFQKNAFQSRRRN